MGNLAIEIFSGPCLVGDLPVMLGESGEDILRNL
jgi:hypothetical protein